jgi:N-acetylneuraminic acid mutarotase
VRAPDGRIYILGGSVSQVDAYNPATNTWSTPSSIPHIYYNVAAALGSDGLIYVAGGDTSTASLAIYDPDSATWTTGPAMPSTNNQFADAAGMNGTLYVFGGAGLNSTTFAVLPTTAVFALDLATRTWTPRAAMPAALFQGRAAMTPSGDIYVIGGLLKGGGIIVDPQATTYRYSPATDSW